MYEVQITGVPDKATVFRRARGFAEGTLGQGPRHCPHRERETGVTDLPVK